MSNANGRHGPPLPSCENPNHDALEQRLAEALGANAALQAAMRRWGEAGAAIALLGLDALCDIAENPGHQGRQTARATLGAWATTLDRVRRISGPLAVPSPSDVARFGEGRQD